MIKFYLCLLLLAGACTGKEKNRRGEDGEDIEMERSIKEQFLDLDIDQDDGVTAEEIEIYMTSRGYTGGDVHVIANQIFMDFDENKDQVVTYEEFSKPQLTDEPIKLSKPEEKEETAEVHSEL